MKFEVEQKFRVPDVARLEERLAAAGAKLEPPQIQSDQYFAHPSRDFANTDEALRIRRVGDENWITYKGPKLDQTTKTRHEMELPIAAGDDGAAAFGDLFKVLGFRPVAEVRKSRRKATILWQGQEIEAAVDEVDGLGSFAELEIVTDQDKIDAMKRLLQSLAQHLGLKDSERRSYLELLLQDATPPAALRQD